MKRGKKKVKLLSVIVLMAIILTSGYFQLDAQAGSYSHWLADGGTGGQSIVVWNDYLHQETRIGPTINNHQLTGVGPVFCMDPFQSPGSTYTEGDSRSYLAADLSKAIVYAAMYNDGAPGGWGFTDLQRKIGLQMCIFANSQLGQQHEGNWAYLIFGSDSPYISAMEQGFAQYTNYSSLPLGMPTLKVPSFSSNSKGSGTPVKLEYNSATACYVGTLTDSNKVLSYYDFSTLGDGVSYSRNGNTLTVSVPESLYSTLFTSTYSSGGITYPRYNTNGVTGTSSAQNYIDYQLYSAGEGYQPLIYGKVKSTSATNTAYLSFYLAESTIEINKTSDDGIKKDFTFNVAGPMNFTLTTDANGYAKKTGLTPGTYTVTEVQKDAYIPTDSQTKEAPAGKTVTFNFSNTVKKMTINVTKKDFDSKISVPQGEAALDGAVYGLYRVSDGSEVGRYTVKNGIFSVGGVPLSDTYYLQEITPPIGYKLDTNKYPITVDPAKVVQTVDLDIDVVEEVQRGAFKIVKMDAQEVTPAQGDATLEGAQFEIYSGRENQPVYIGEKVYQAGDLIETIATDSTGIAVSSALPFGQYRIVEKTPPRGYLNSGLDVLVKNHSGNSLIEVSQIDVKRN